MKIIVTGCRGQLGTEIIKQLREGRSELGPIPEKLVSATVIPVDLPELDITNYKMVDDFIRRQRPDVIINCAAFTNVDGCEVNHDTAFKANAIGPRNLAQAATKTGARLVIPPDKQDLVFNRFEKLDGNKKKGTGQIGRASCRERV